MGQLSPGATAKDPACLSEDPASTKAQCSQINKYMFLKLIYLLWLPWVFTAVGGLSPAAASGGSSLWLLPAAVSPVADQQEALELSDCSSCGSQAADQGLRSCDAWVLLPRGMWNLPCSGMKPMSSVSAGRLSTTGPPREVPR